MENQIREDKLREIWNRLGRSEDWQKNHLIELGLLQPQTEQKQTPIKRHGSLKTQRVSFRLSPENRAFILSQGQTISSYLNALVQRERLKC